MKKILTLALTLAMIIPSLAIDLKKVKPVKNIIVLIADGTSLSAISGARWLQRYRDSIPNLNLDPYMSGTIITCNSDAPIGDSAPTTSCYMTGHRSRAGYVATFPPDKGDANLYYVDPARSYAPAATILEAATQLQGKSAGLVVTCRFPHATPADCSAHYYNRNAYGIIADQMAHNNVSVMIGGGTSFLSAESKEYLQQQGVNVYLNDINAMRADKSNKMWALFGSSDMSYDVDRDETQQPSLAEMTKTAISKLSTNKKGFFLMVEGSKCDMAAHANDPSGLLYDVLAFDRACGEALEFARKDGNTAVIITADHGNSGFSISRYDVEDYAHQSLEQLFGQVAKYRLSADGLEAKINSMPFDSLKSIFKTYCDIDLSKDEVLLLVNSRGYDKSPLPEELRSPDKSSPLYSSHISGVLSKILTAHTPFGWTSYGHTAEDVFLACYNPHAHQQLAGVNTNVDLAHYLQALFGMYGKMEEFNDNIFAPHATVFKDYDVEMQKPQDKKLQPTLIVKNKANGHTLTIRPFTNTLQLTANNTTKDIQLPSVITYVDRNDMFYLPKNLVNYLK